MSYQVIARRYRPKTFDEVVGQEHVTKTLRNAIEANRIHHAYLLAGPRGIGKTTVARILARAFNCEKGPTINPCGECVQCKEISSGASMDVQEIDGASNTGVDDVREIRDRAKYLPASSRYKLYIIDEVHMLSTAAFNALLKILEEPPAHVIFMFATTEPHKIPITILSRCQRYDFRRIPVPKIEESLKSIADIEGINIDKESLSLISHEAQGSLRDAQSLLDQPIAFSGKNVELKNIESMLGFLDRKLIFDLLKDVLNKNVSLALKKLNSVFEIGVDLTRFATEFLGFLRNIMVIKKCGFEASLIDLPKEEAESLADLSQKVSYEELQQMFHIWYLNVDSVARTSFPKMFLEVTLIKIMSVEPVKPIADIIMELERLSGNACLLDTKNNKEERTVENKQNIIKKDADISKPVEQGDVDELWKGFLKWLGQSSPQLASIFGHGTLINLSNDVVQYSMENPFYAEMLQEEDRKTQVLKQMKAFFKKDMMLDVSGINKTVKNIEAAKVEHSGNHEKIEAQVIDTVSKQKKKKDLTKEALESDIVREAANIFEAKVHDVRTDFEEK